MDLKDFALAFAAARKAGESLVFFCTCAITYSGRAEARLGEGERLVVIKSDGVLLIHQPTGGMPINYLKAGSTLTLEKKEKHYLLKGVFQKEILEIDLYRVFSCMSRRLDDGAKQVLAGNEKDMSDMIKDNPHLISPDFIPLSREEHTKFGFIDVFGHDAKGNLIIIECKRFTASLAAVTQLRRYVEKIKSLKGISSVTGILASPTISPNALSMLQEWGFSWKEVHPPKRLEHFNKKQQKLDAF
ncbi:MAG: DUF91 domain-containing protein [Candidatus Woesearchaeota archaeon]|nr:MAG: DUF91 domain-containing protein [Candidatus Woesearchaeota archaeon]